MAVMAVSAQIGSSGLVRKFAPAATPAAITDHVNRDITTVLACPRWCRASSHWALYPAPGDRSSAATCIKTTGPERNVQIHALGAQPGPPCWRWTSAVRLD
jgi:hypothetical protein